MIENSEAFWHRRKCSIIFYVHICQALLQMDELEAAVSALEYYTSVQPHIRSSNQAPLSLYLVSFIWTVC